MQVGLLGVLEARDHDGAIIAVPGHRQRALLALLALRPNSVTPAERLIDDLWAEVPVRQPANALQVVVFKLRKAIGADLVDTRPPGYVLRVAEEDVDAFRFERLVGEGRAALAEARVDDALDRFDRAQALWRDAALLQFLDMPTAYAAATRWEELRESVIEDRLEALLATGRSGDLVAELNDAVAAAPYRERLRRQLMLALYRSGRQADALRVFADTRRVLADELGLEPGPELRALEAAILAHDPALESVARSRSVASRPESPHTHREQRAPRPDVVEARAGAQLIGRESEMAALGLHLDALVATRGGVTLISGEPGIGKSRLAEELGREAVRQDVVVLWGRCHSAGGAPAFWPWTQTIDAALDRFDSDRIRSALRLGASDMSQLVPEIKELYDDLPAPSGADPDTARFRLYDAVAGFVRRLARDTPMLIVLDDLQWADAASLELLGIVAADTAHVALMVLGTYRTVQPVVGGNLAEALAEISRHSDVRRIELEGLEPASVATLFAERGVELGTSAVDSMHSRTRGNPFFVTEIARLIEASDPGDRQRVSQLVPSSVRDVVQRRVSHLPAATTELLGAAAVAGPEIDLVMLSSVLGSDVERALAAIEPAVDAGLVTSVGRHAARFRFAHGLVGETIYGDLRPSARARLHLSTAKFLESHRGGGRDAGLLRIADHYVRAAPLAPTTATVNAVIDASRWAVAHVAHDQAEQLLRTALEVVVQLSDDERPRHELALLSELSTLQIVRGSDRAELDLVCARMEVLIDAVGDSQTVAALWRLSVYRSSLLQLDRAIEIGRKLLHIGEARDDRALSMAGLIALGPPHLMRGELDVAAEYLDGALAGCRSGNDWALHGMAMETPGVLVRNFAAIVAALRGDAEAADRLVIESADVGAAEGPTTFALALAVGFGGWVSAILGDAGTARTRSERASAIAAEGGHDVRLVTTPVHGWATAALGDPRAGIDEIESADHLVASTGMKLFGSFRHALLADALLAAGEIDRVLELTNEALQEAEVTGERWCDAELHRARGRAHAALGAADDAAVELRLAVYVAEQQGALTFAERAKSDLTQIAG